jgi:hypothetical protein
MCWRGLSEQTANVTIACCFAFMKGRFGSPRPAIPCIPSGIQSVTVDRAIDHTIKRRLLTAGARVQSQGTLCRVLVETALRQAFSPGTFVLPCQLSFHQSFTLSSVILRLVQWAHSWPPPTRITRILQSRDLFLGSPYHMTPTQPPIRNKLYNLTIITSVYCGKFREKKVACSFIPNQSLVFVPFTQRLTCG